MPIPSFEGRPVLVTGGAGFIGSHLVDALLARGARVRVLDNFATGHRENLAHVLDRLELVDGDIRDLNICLSAAADVAIVFHLAALGSVPRSMKDPSTTFAVNVHGTVNVFTACRDTGAKRIVFASSSSVYGDSPRLPKREGEEGEPLSPYALSKVMNEQLARIFSRCYGMQLFGLRYFNVFGPRQDPKGPYAAVLPRFLQACFENRPLQIHGDGTQSRDFTFVGDAVRANLLACTAPASASGRAYNVAGGNRTSVEDLAVMVQKVAGTAPGVEHGPSRPGDVLHSEADLSGARSGLGFEPQTPLSEGLRMTVDYYRQVFSAA